MTWAGLSVLLTAALILEVFAALGYPRDVAGDWAVIGAAATAAHFCAGEK